MTIETFDSFQGGEVAKLSCECERCLKFMSTPEEHLGSRMADPHTRFTPEPFNSSLQPGI
jgi:hypothetical protein